MDEQTRELFSPPTLKDIPTSEEHKRTYIDWYVAETGFPRSAERIRQHLAKVFDRASKETSLPLLFAGCDHYCSIGEGNNTAVPGSDVEALFFLTEREVTEEETVAFTSAVLRKVNPMVVGHITKWNTVRKNFIPLSIFERLKNTDWQASQGQIGAEARYLLREIIHGTKIFDSNSPLVGTIRKSRLGQTVPPLRTMEEDKMPRIRKNKYKSRALLAKLFPQLILDEQYAVVRTQLVKSLPESSILDPINLKVGGPESEILEQLYNRDLYYKEYNLSNQDTYYEPKWIYGEAQK